MVTLIHKIDWLFDEDLPPSELGHNLSKIQFPYPSELATGYKERLQFNDGISLVKDTHKFTNEDRPYKFSLGHLKVESSPPAFAYHVMHSGYLEIFDNTKKILYKRAPGIDFFGRLSLFDHEQVLFTEEDISLSAIYIPETHFVNLLGAETADNFYHSLGLLNVTDCCEARIPKTITHRIATCAPDHLQGSMRSMFAYSVILQFILDLNLFIASSKSFVNHFEKNDVDIASLHAELLQVTTDIPKLSDLAQKYNVTAAKLNQSFIKQYGQSIYSFLSNQRLDQAHQALLSTDIAMKTLAHKIGYSHVNHFITAFKKKFGVTPGSLRNQSKSLE
jgi:AraC-like DNA-binding protein